MEHERIPHDPSYKQFFSNPDMVASLLRDFVPEDFIRELDFSTLEQCSGSYVTDDLRERHDDIVWRLRWNNSWCYLYLLLEFQSTSDPWMAVRILAYTALLWQDLIKSGVVREGDRLPPVFPMVIYNGGKAWTAAQDVADLLTPVSGPLRHYQPCQRYFLLDEGQVSEETLHGDGLVTQLVRLERANSLDVIQPIVRGLIRQLHEPKYRHLRRVLSVWLGRVVFKRAGITQNVPEFQDLQEVDAMLEERAAQWKDEYIQQGMLIGEARGKAEGIGLALRDILEARFGTLPQSVASYIASSSDSNALRKLTLSAYHAESLQSFMDQIKKNDSKIR